MEGFYFLRMPEVIKKTGLSRSTIYMRISTGTFPKGVKLGERSVAWRSSDISEWMFDPMGWTEKEF